MSHPKMCAPMAALWASGIVDRNSIVKYEMHSLASSSKRPSGEGTIAAVGQASIQRVQVPQRSGGGASEASGSIESVVRSSPRKNHDPSCWLMRQVFLPIQPNPACLAIERSSRGAVSTHTLDLNISISNSL